jgi:hypothetical protein
VVDFTVDAFVGTSGGAAGLAVDIADSAQDTYITRGLFRDLKWV